jgi:hypothetical protein
MAAHYYKCRLCEAQFDNLEDRQRPELIDHIQKGEIPQKRTSKYHIEMRTLHQ